MFHSSTWTLIHHLHLTFLLHIQSTAPPSNYFVIIIKIN